MSRDHQSEEGRVRGRPADPESLRVQTRLVAAGRPHEPGAPLNVPLIAASNFQFRDTTGYARDDGNDSWRALETAVGALEGGAALSFSSGMGAVAAVFALLRGGARVVLPDDCYQGVVALAEQGAERNGWQVQRVALPDTASWKAALQGEHAADLVWLESPSNPLLELADLPTVCAARREPGTLLAIDNTFATPLNQRPLELGADLVMHSATKFLGGHSDLLSGMLVCRDPSLHERLRRVRELHGATPGTLETFLALRGLRTLHLRLRAGEANAAAIADWLERHTAVLRVRHPGLATHPQHDWAREHLEGFGTIVSFEVRGGAAAADELCTRLRVIRHATSLGAVESTIERRGAIPGQEHLPPGLLRLSVGIEAVDDLTADLEQALAGL
ncbi:MAG: PLP-dependent transferase [Acidobacteria bacterium]|nr:MAG: PLP-dependent transferase [Acidobacteriota bacterium]REK12175.1 MAG: PLP-dependent transferase [Acidobacteriota bacterium]